MAKLSKNRITKIKKLRKGLAIYKTPRSPFWYIRLRDSVTKKYVTRSSTETAQLEAMRVAHEFAGSHLSNVDSKYAAEKLESFEHFAKILIRAQMGKSQTADGDRKLLNRSVDGIISYFGKYQVSKINTGMVRDYLINLDENRNKPLANSTKSKHCIVIRKVLTIAMEDGIINSIPIMPKQKTKDTPRHPFTEEGFKSFISTAFACARRGDKVRGVPITGNHAKMFLFLFLSFLRPTEGELFGLTHKDVTIKTDPSHLELNVRQGKTGRRTSATMSLAVPLYQSLYSPFQTDKPNGNQYVWMPEFNNRTTAINTSRRIFNYILEQAGLSDEHAKLTPYSIRHFALQARFTRSGGKVNTYSLAKNAGTSVVQLERFYLKKMPFEKEIIENLQINRDD
nr:phage integrase SAM-like domain-containing protein [Amylibacter sp.]